MSPPSVCSRLLSIALAITIHVAVAEANVCDVDADGDVDVNDLATIRHARNDSRPAPRDPLGPRSGGPIRYPDASACERLCTLPDCAAEAVGVPPVNSPPLATDDRARTTEAVPTTVEVLANDSDPDGDAIQIEFTGAAGKAAVTATADNRVSYAPTAGFVGYDEFEYGISDPSGETAGAMVSMLIEPAEVGSSRLNVRSIDSYVQEGDVGSRLAMFEIELERGSMPGAVSVDFTTVDGSATAFTDYLPIASSVSWADGESGVRLVGVELSGDALVEVDEEFALALRNPVNAVIDTAEARLLIVNDDGDTGNSAPVAVGDAGMMLPDAPFVIDVLANDADPDGDPLTVIGVGQPFSGSATFTANEVIYTPQPGFLGRDYFRYRVADGSGLTDEGLVSVTVVESLNSPPVAVDDFATASGGAPVTVPVLDNDSDVDGDSIAVTAVTQGSHGSVSFTASDVTYVPEAGFAGDDSFTYTVGDGRGGESAATVNVTVEADALPRVEFAFDGASVTEGGPGETSVAVVAVSLVAPAGFDQRVEALIVSEDGSANAYVDYDPLFINLVWGPGDTATKYLLVSVQGDAVVEEDETFDIVLAEVTNAVAGSPDRMTVQIVDDD